MSTSKATASELSIPFLLEPSPSSRHHLHFYQLPLTSIRSAKVVHATRHSPSPPNVYPRHIHHVRVPAPVVINIHYHLKRDALRRTIEPPHRFRISYLSRNVHVILSFQVFYSVSPLCSHILEKFCASRGEAFEESLRKLKVRFGTIGCLNG